MRRGYGPTSFPRETAADRRAARRFAALATVGLVVLVTLAATGCQTTPAPEPDDVTVTADMHAACHDMGGTVDHSSGECLVPGRAPLVYTEGCGYNTPVYGDDC